MQAIHDDAGELHRFVKGLDSFSAALISLAEDGNDRLNINQTAFFLLAAVADVRGSPLTLKELMDRTDGAIGKSVMNTYKALLEAKGRNPKTGTALGWLSRETDPNDERRKYLRLTPLGRSVAKRALRALNRSG